MASVGARRRILRAAHGCGDVLPGDFVRLISGHGLGIVNSISGDCALVSDLARPGHRDVLPIALLMRAVRT